jgi:nucleoside-diphosphate-sugar epimerase
VIHNQAFNVGTNDENYRIRDLAEIVRDTVPGCMIEYAQGAGPDKRTYRVDFTKIARSLPEFKPQWNARRGARQLFEAFQCTGLEVEEFEGPRYMRIKQVKELLSTNRLDGNLRWQE